MWPQFHLLRLQMQRKLKSSNPFHDVLFAAFLNLVSGQLPDVYQQGPLQPYTGYSDVTLFKYHVPPATSTARWQFAAVHDDAGCQARPVHV